MALKLGKILKGATKSVKKVVKKAAKPVLSNPALKQLAAGAMGPGGGALLDVAGGQNVKDAVMQNAMSQGKAALSSFIPQAGGFSPDMFAASRGEPSAESSSPGFLDQLSGFFNAKDVVGNQTLPYGIEGSNPMQDYQGQYEDYLRGQQDQMRNYQGQYDDFLQNQQDQLRSYQGQYDDFLKGQAPTQAQPAQQGFLSKYAPFLEGGAQIAGGIGGYFLGKGEREKAEDIYRQAQNEYANLQATQQGPSAYENDPYIAQALGKMSQFSSTGMTPELQAEIAQRDRDIAAQQQADRAAAQESLQRRFGSGASGAEAAAAISGQQEAANRRALYRQQDLAQASVNQRAGAQDLFNAAGNKAQQQDAISRFNAANMQQNNQFRAAGVANQAAPLAQIKMGVGQQKANLADKAGAAVAGVSRAYRGFKKPGEEQF